LIPGALVTALKFQVLQEKKETLFRIGIQDDLRSLPLPLVLPSQDGGSAAAAATAAAAAATAAATHKTM
jgi:hypothetical protein